MNGTDRPGGRCRRVGGQAARCSGAGRAGWVALSSRSGPSQRCPRGADESTLPSRIGRRVRRASVRWVRHRPAPRIGRGIRRAAVRWDRHRPAPQIGRRDPARVGVADPAPPRPHGMGPPGSARLDAVGPAQPRAADLAPDPARLNAVRPAQPRAADRPPDPNRPGAVEPPQARAADQPPDPNRPGAVEPAQTRAPAGWAAGSGPPRCGGAGAQPRPRVVGRWWPVHRSGRRSP